MEKVVKKLKLNEESTDLDFWLTKSYSERLNALEVLREHYIKYFLNGHRPEFQRVINKISLQNINF